MQYSSDSLHSNLNQQIISPIERTVMVFYAYVKQSTDTWSYRYVMAFASREVADEWWRAVSTSSVVSFANSIRRVNAQFYLHDVNQANAANSLVTAGVATEFLNKVIFLLMDDLGGRQLSVIPSPDHLVDHISGNSFFIRSQTSPYEYWYCPLLSDGKASNEVYVSRNERTRFRVDISNKGSAGIVMIGSDEIAITLPTISLSIHITDGGRVILSPAPQVGLKFSDLLNKFTVGPPSKSDPSLKELFYTDNGEDWELA